MYPINDSFVANKFYLLKRGTFIDFLEKYNQNTMQANYNDFIDTKVFNIDKNYSFYSCERSFTKYLLNLPLL